MTQLLKQPLENRFGSSKHQKVNQESSIYQEDYTILNIPIEVSKSIFVLNFDPTHIHFRLITFRSFTLPEYTKQCNHYQVLLALTEKQQLVYCGLFSSTISFSPSTVITKTEI